MSKTGWEKKKRSTLLNWHSFNLKLKHQHNRQLQDFKEIKHMAI